jgi:phosphatidate cytidylyltransferase
MKGTPKLSNTAQRILVSVFAIPALLLISYLGSWYFYFFVLIICLLSFYELSKISESKGALINLSWGIIGIVIIISNAFFKNTYDNFLLVAIWYLLLVLIEMFRNRGSALINIGLTSLGFLFFSVSGYSLILIRELYNTTEGNYLNGGYLIISLFITIWICDSAAFFGGTKFGKHKLFPRVSPNKSWEGAAFGFVGAIISMLIIDNFFLSFLSTSESIVIGIIIGTIGQIGDLVESMFKRDAGIKDSSNLIPGHGGVFDRFDSLFFSAPFIYLYLDFIL